MKKNHIPIFLRDYFLYLIVFILIFSSLLSSINTSVLKNFYLFADITTQDLLSLVNQQRILNGLPPLINNSKLNEAAFLKGQDMAINNYFAHYSPKGTSPWYWLDVSGYFYNYAGENLAIDFFDANSAVQAWMNSPLHKENILNPNYTETGIAVVQSKISDSGQIRYILVQNFGSRFWYEPNTLPAKNISLSIPTTTTTSLSITTTLDTKVLGLTKTQAEKNISTSVIRNEDLTKEAENTIPKEIKEKKQILDSEIYRISLLSQISFNERTQYFFTIFFNSKVSFIINLIIGLFLIFLTLWHIFKIKKEDIKISRKLHVRNIFLGIMGILFIIISFMCKLK